MATAAQNYQMLEETLARNLSSPINNYIAANTALALQRAQQSQDQARVLADRQEARNFQVEQQGRQLENQKQLQALGLAGQRELTELQIRARGEERSYETLVRQAAAARQDPIMAGFDPAADPATTVAEFYRRQGPEFSNPFYAERVSETDTRLQNGIAQLQALTSGASEEARIRALRTTASDPAVQQTLLDNGVSGKDIAQLAQTGDPALFKRIQDVAVKNAGGIFGRKGPSGRTLLDLQNAYFANLGEASGVSKDNPAFFPVLADIQAAAKQRSDYMGRITDKKLLTDLSGLKPAPAINMSSLEIPRDPAVVDPALPIGDYLRGIQSAPRAVPAASAVPVVQPAFNLNTAVQSFGLPPQAAVQNPLTLAATGAYVPQAPLPQAPALSPFVNPSQAIPYSAPANLYRGF